MREENKTKASLFLYPMPEGNIFKYKVSDFQLKIEKNFKKRHKLQRKITPSECYIKNNNKNQVQQFIHFW